MPYIKVSDRDSINEMSESLIDMFVNAPTKDGKFVAEGELNYAISKLVWAIFDKHRSYSTGNRLVGVLECVKQEFIRRRLNDYEDEKIKENGDI